MCHWLDAAEGLPGLKMFPRHFTQNKSENTGIDRFCFGMVVHITNGSWPQFQMATLHSSYHGNTLAHPMATHVWHHLAPMATLVWLNSGSHGNTGVATLEWQHSGSHGNTCVAPLWLPWQLWCGWLTHIKALHSGFKRTCRYIENACLLM